jgi:hypothetical protein
MLKDVYIRAEVDVTEEKVTNKKTVVVTYILAGVCFCLNGLAAKLLYDRHPEMSSWHLLAYRASVSCVISVIMQNTNLKYVMYDSVPSSEIPALVFRTL